MRDSTRSLSAIFSVASALSLGVLSPAAMATDQDVLEGCLEAGFFHSHEYWPAALEVLDCSSTYIQSKLAISPDNQDPIGDAELASGLQLGSAVDESDGLLRRAYPFCGPHQAKHFETFDFDGLNSVTIAVDDLLAGTNALQELRILLMQDLGSGPELVEVGSDTNGANGWSITFNVASAPSPSVMVLQGLRENDAPGSPDSGRAFPVGDAGATILTLNPVQDNSIYEIDTGSLTNGAGDYLFAGLSLQPMGRRHRVAFLGFDIDAQVPAGAVITRASLRIEVSRTPGVLAATRLHRVTTDWGEGTSDAINEEGIGASPTTDDCTWLHSKFPSQFWNSPGGDYANTPSASIDIGLVGTYAWPSTDLTVADVQEWLDQPANDFGWAVVGEDAFPGSVKRFNSRENPNVNERPLLTIEYVTVDSPAASNAYGEGWPGTLGIPDMSLGGLPELGTTVPLLIDNSSGAATIAVLMVGLQASKVPTALGGDLNLLPLSIVPLALPAGQLNLPATIPPDAFLCGLRVFLQTLESDGGASQGVSFTPGLKLTLGD